MARTTIPMKLTSIRALTSNLMELQIQTFDENTFRFKTGQFVMLHVPQQIKSVLRAYSLASSDTREDGFNLLIKLVPNGIASQFIERLRGGEILQFTGPFGKCFFRSPPAPQVLFLCTGAGLAQHYSMLVSEAHKFPNTRFHLLVGVWTENDVFYRDELEKLQKSLPNLNMDFVVDKPKNHWEGKVGYVTDFLPLYDYKNKDTHIYLCGAPAMIESAKKILFEQNGFPKERVFIEAF